MTGAFSIVGASSDSSDVTAGNSINSPIPYLLLAATRMT